MDEHGDRLAQDDRKTPSMKLMFFTPTVKSSAIARSNKLVVAALDSLGHEILVVRSEAAALFDQPAHDFGTEMLRWNNATRISKIACDADAIVYAIGDNYPLHCGCIEWLPTLPGIICLHDYFLGNLFWAWAESRRPEARAILCQWYGAATADKYFTYSNSTDFIAGTHRTAPMTEWIASKATALITHSGWDIDRILDACPGPVYTVPCAYDQPAANQYAPPANPTIAADDFVILTIGHINPNKRAESVIRAIGDSVQLSEKALYHLVGPIEPVELERLSGLARRLGVRIAISGEVDDMQLRQAIERADIMACLRSPVLEAASGSAIESMLCGKATVVMDAGFYAYLPDSCVRKVPVSDELAGLLSELEFLYNNPEERRAQGKRAADWARDTFSATRYAREIIDIAVAAAKATPVIAASRFFGKTLASWGAVDPAVYMSNATLAPLALFDKTLSE